MQYRGIVNGPGERTRVTWPWVFWDDAFKPKELDAIIEMCESAPKKEATTLGDPSKTDQTVPIRVSNVSFHKRDDRNGWVFQRINSALEVVNNSWYGFKLNGYDAFQYTEYHAVAGGKYDWHMDTCLAADFLPTDMIEPRKLSMSLFLNDPAEYEGGELQFNLGMENTPQTALAKRGRMIVFPSFMIHRVAPLSRGVRKSLVVWVTGPKFE